MEFKNVIYTESQKFNQKWWRFIIIIGVFSHPILMTIFYFSKLSKIEDLYLQFIISGLVGFLILYLAFGAKLLTIVNSEGIYYRFYPFNIKWKKIEYNDIKSCYAREYSPILEYGGWGIRYGFTNGKAYNTSGNMGIQFELANNKKILIGTQKPDEFSQAISKFYKTSN